MKITRVNIHNFRSIRDIKFRCGAVTVLLGPNNHGKSNVLAALDFFFSSSAKLKPGDFFHHRDLDDDVAWVEVRFAALSEQERTTFQKYLDHEGQICIRKTAVLSQTEGKVEANYRGYLPQAAEEWLRSSYSPKKEDLHEKLAPHLPEGRFSKVLVGQAQDAYIAVNRASIVFEYALEDSPLLGAKNVAAGVLPDAFLIPAVRDLTADTAVKSTTMFGRLLNRAIAEMAAADEQFKRLRSDLGTLMSRLNRASEGPDGRPEQLVALERGIVDELKGWGVSLDIRIEPPEVEKLFELGTSLHVDDGVRTPAEEKGHGLQRAMIFALTRAWAESLRKRPGGEDPSARGRSESVLLLVEEPELYLHPHAQRRLDANLRSIGAAEHHQVFLCTHSPQFVRMDDYRNICMLYKPSAASGTAARQCEGELFSGDDHVARKARFNASHWVNPDRAEMFFARRVVFVEGATEKVLLPYLAERLGKLDHEVSIVDCGSKYNLPLYMEVAGAFGLDHVVVHDEDPVAAGLVGDKLAEAKRTFGYNDTIAKLASVTKSVVKVLAPDFERSSGVSKSQGEKKGKPLAALDHFSEIDTCYIPAPLRDVVEAAYSKGGG